MYENPLLSFVSYLDPAATMTPRVWIWEATSLVATMILFGNVVIRVSGCRKSKKSASTSYER